MFMDRAGMYMDSENYDKNVDALTCSDVKAWTYLIQFLRTPYSSRFPGPNPATYHSSAKCQSEQKGSLHYQNFIQDVNMLSFPNKFIGL